MHFNTPNPHKGERVEHSTYNEESFNSSSTSLYINPEYNDANLVVIGTIRVDENSRLRFPKRMKNVFPLFPKDVIVVYQNLINSDLIFKVQHHNEMSTVWIIKKNTNNKPLIVNNDDLKDKYVQIEENSTSEDNKNEIQNDLISKIKLMIVDDNPDVLRTYEVIFKEFFTRDIKKPYIIDSFDSSIDAVKYFTEIYRNYNNSYPYYDLVIVDIKMPKINGIKLYQILKIIDFNIKILFVSGLNLVKELDNMIPGLLADDVILKPFDIGELYSKVKKKLILLH